MLGKRKIGLFIFLFGLLANVAILVGFPIPIIRALVSIVFILFIPGLLILLNIIDDKPEIWEILFFSLGLSIFLLTFCGLILNQSSGILHITRPLQNIYILPTIDLISTLLLLRYLIIKDKLHKKYLSFQKRDIFLSFFSVFPIISAIGAAILNNNGVNTYTVLLILMVVAYVLCVVIFRSYFSPKAIVVSLWFVGLSLIYMYSLRSHFLVGWDIQTEFRIFSITYENAIWSLQNVTHAYNTTLGLTIFPTILANFSGLSAEVIFKVIYPIIFSVSAPIIYIVIKKFSTSTVAFLSSFFFIAQFQFFQQMPALARQEIALLFFFLTVLVFFTKNFGYWVRTIMFLCFSLGIIVCHYSTAYITVAVFTGVYFATIPLRITNKFRPHFDLPRSIITLPMLIALAFFTFFWYGVFTGSLSYLSTFAETMINNISKVSVQDNKSEQAKAAITGSSGIYTMNDISAYEQNIVRDYKLNKPWVTFYLPSDYDNYSTIIRYPESVPSRSLFVQYSVKNFIELDQKLIKLTIMITLLSVSVIILLKRHNKIPLHFVVFAWVFLFLVILSIAVPFISVAYNIERLYQQSLIFLGFFVALGLSFPVLIHKLNPTIGYGLVSILFVSYFVSYSGLMYSFFGGPATLNLNNFGDEYERFYIKDGEQFAATWLTNNAIAHPLVYSDSYGWLRLQSYTRYSDALLTDLYPGVIDKYGYVYASYANYVKGNVRTTYNNEFMMYNFPKDFLNDNKSLIYNNKISAIYH